MSNRRPSAPAPSLRLTDRGYVALAVMVTILAVILFRPAVWAVTSMTDLLVLSAPVAVPVMIAVPLWLALLSHDARTSR